MRQRPSDSALNRFLGGVEERLAQQQATQWGDLASQVPWTVEPGETFTVNGKTYTLGEYICDYPDGFIPMGWADGPPAKEVHT